MSVEIIAGDCREVLRSLPAGSVQCCITSPPYWGLRDYGVSGQLGLEATPEEYVANMVDVFREVKRVLRDDGIVFLNLGDSYASQGGPEPAQTKWQIDGASSTQNAGQSRRAPVSLKPKDLVGIPWRTAFALQDDGWWLRSDIIWNKPNCMPESVTDRPTKSHEYVFLLTKAARYFYDADAVRERATDPEYIEKGKMRPTKDPMWRNSNQGDNRGGLHNQIGGRTHRNRRSVWTISTRGFPGAHFATFPPALVEPMIKAGTSERGACPSCGVAWRRVVEKTGEVDASAKGSRFDIGKTAVHGNGRAQQGERYTNRTTGWRPACACATHGDDIHGGPNDVGELSGVPFEPVPCLILDPFAGAGTVSLVAEKLGRDSIGIELSPDYAQMAKDRIEGELGTMFSAVDLIGFAGVATDG